MFNRNFILRSLLVIAHWFVLTGARDVCIWCDRRMTIRFMNCMFVEIVSNPVLDALERDLLLDMKSSLFAASSSFNSSPDQMKSQIMNGALAGEVSGMISSHSAATGQRPEVAMDAIMDLIGGCYFSVTQRPESHFVNSLRIAVKDIISDDESYEPQGKDAVSMSNKPVRNSDYNQNSFQTANQPLPIPQENVLRNTDRQPFVNNYSDRPTQDGPLKSSKATATAISSSNRDIGDRPPVVTQIYDTVPNNPVLPNRNFVPPFENQYFDHWPSAGVSPVQENLPASPRQSGESSASSFSNQGFNSPSSPVRPQIPLKDLANGPFPNQDLNRQPPFQAQPKIYETQTELLPSRKLPPLTDQSFKNREPSPELPSFHKSVPVYPLSTSDGGFAPFPNKDLSYQPPPQQNIFRTERYNPTPNQDYPALTSSNNNFADGMPQIRETVPPNPSMLNKELPASFIQDGVDQKPYVSQSQKNEDMPSKTQQSSQFISDRNWNPALRQPDYDYPVYINKNVYETPKPVLRPPDYDEYPVFTNENVYQNPQSNFPAQSTSNSYAAQQASEFLQPLQSNTNGFDSSQIVPSKVNDFGSNDIGQQTAQLPQGVPAMAQSSQHSFDQNIPYVGTDGLFYDNSKSVNPTEVEGMNFQPVVPSSYQSQSNEDKFQRGSKTTNQDNEECALQFSETLFVHLIKTKIVHSVLGTNTLPASVEPTVSEAVRRAFIDNGMSEYADEVADYCSRQIGSLPESSSTQAFADQISKSATDVLYRNEALKENCSERAISMAVAISRWLEIFENEKTTKTDTFVLSNAASSNLDKNQERKDDGSATAVSTTDVQQEEGYEYEYCDDEPTDSTMQQTKTDKESDQYDYCEDDEDESTTNPGESILQFQKDDGSQKSKLSDSESRRQLEILMSSIKNSMSNDGFNYQRLTSAMSSIASEMDDKHLDWDFDEVYRTTSLQTIVALTLVLQETAMSQS